MPKIAGIRSAVADLPSDGLPLVVVLAGGTTGIGSYVAKALAKTYATQGARLRVYIVGRNAQRAESVISQAKGISPDSDWRFVRAVDLAYISEVDAACAKVMEQETAHPLHTTPSIDLLYMSHCYPIFKKPTETKEGLDSFLSTVYYSRIRFATQLMPLLIADPRPGHVVSIYAGGMEDGTTTGDCPIGLPPPEQYGLNSVRKHASFMLTFMFEELAAQHEGKLSLIHIFPGLVDGPTFYSSDTPVHVRMIWRLTKPLMSWYMTSPDDCGMVMVYLATDHFSPRGVVKDARGRDTARSTLDEIGGGCYAVGQRGDVANKRVLYDKARTSNTRQLVLDHTMQTFSRVEQRRESHTPATEAS